MPEKHLSTQFDSELSAVSTRVMEMGGLVESQIQQAIYALSQFSVEVANVVSATESRVNAMEVDIDRELSSIIARRQPTARDLRLLIAISKITANLERVGDEAKKIALMAREFFRSGRAYMPRYLEIQRMSAIVMDMLRQALDGFARLDAEAAPEIARRDVEVDDSFRAVLRELLTYMIEDPRTISATLDIIFIAKALERVGDHAKNISEYVVYMIKGRDVRHLSAEEIEQALKS